MQPRSISHIVFPLGLGFVFIVSLWIRMAFPVVAIGAPHDDMLFASQAVSIGMGQWLGPYNNLTHAKGAGYPIFLFLNHVTGLPLKVSEHAVYLACALCFALTAGQMQRSRKLALVTFVLLAFLPTLWNPGVGGRVVRDNLYISFSLLLLTLGFRCWCLPTRADGLASVEPLSEQVRAKWPAMIALGLVAGAYWVIREEGVWLVPSMLVMLLYWLWRHRTELRAWRPLLAMLVIPLGSAAIVVCAVNGANYVRYGVFRNNDFRSADFQAGYGALTRVRHDAWHRYVLFPREARQRAYEMSAAARELQPFFEGQGGENWRAVGCNQTQTSPCPEILSAWFVWALRDAVASAGHYRDAQDARQFYRRLAAEIDAGCRQRPQDCLPYRSTLVPPWQPVYAQDTTYASLAVFKTLLGLGNDIRIGESWGSPEQVAMFARVTNGTPAPLAGAAPVLPPSLMVRDAVRLRAAQWIGQQEIRIMTVGLPCMLAVWCLWVVSMLWARKPPGPALVLATALVAALFTRVVLLAFLDVTSIPSNNMLYLAPVAPMALALVPLTLWGFFRFVRPPPDSPDRMVPHPPARIG